MTVTEKTASKNTRTH